MTICYHPELGEKKPLALIEARLSCDGKHYVVDTALDLKGRGITRVSVTWAEGSLQQRAGYKSYRVTLNAFKKLEAAHTITMPCYLD